MKGITRFETAKRDWINVRTKYVREKDGDRKKTKEKERKTFFRNNDKDKKWRVDMLCVWVR